MEIRKLVFEIIKIEIETGFVGLCPMPGKFSSFDEDFLQLVKELPQVVVTCATQPEMMACSATRLPEKLYNSEIKWFHIDVDDFQIPDEFSEEKWNSLLPILKETIFVAYSGSAPLLVPSRPPVRPSARLPARASACSLEVLLP